MLKTFGFSSVLIFGITLVTIANLTPDFSYLNDFVSKLGAQGQPYAMWWNMIGFLLVGILLAAFGYSYGKTINDRLAGICLALFGIGFAITSIPIEPGNTESALSTAHVVAICHGLASWMFGLARIAHLESHNPSVKYGANIAATLVVLPMFGFVAGLCLCP